MTETSPEPLPNQARPRPRRAAAIAGLLLILSACIPEPPDNDEVLDYRRDSPMGLIQDAGVLRVGIEAHPPFSSPEPSPEGFIADYARDVAAALGVDVEFEVADRDTLPSLVKGDEPALDVVFPLLPITEDVARHNAVTDPYWVGHQRILATDAAGAGAGTSTCLIPGPTTIDVDGIEPDRIGAEQLESEDRSATQTLQVAATGTAEECLRLLESKRETIAAAAGPDVELMWLAARVPDLYFVGDELTTEGYGAFVRNDLPGLADFVNTQLAEADAEGRWTQWYLRWLAPHINEPVPAPPDMTAEEAAALYPAELAQP